MRELLDLWYKQKAAMEAPYDGDLVQAWGLAFAYVYFKAKDELCARFGIDPDEFSYGLKHDIISRLEKEKA